MKLIYKILIPIILILVVVFVAIGFFTTDTFKGLLFDEKAKALISSTQEHNGIFFSDTELNQGLPEASADAKMKLLHKEITEPSIFRVKVWDPNFKIIHSDLEEIVGNKSTDEAPQIGSLFLNDSIAKWSLVTQFKDNSTEKSFGPYLDIFVPVKNSQGKVFYVIEIFSTTSAILTALQSRIQEIAFFLSGIAILFCIVLYIFIHFIITKPIRSLSDAMDIVGAGHLSYEISNNSKDEIGALYRKFNTMRTQLKNYLEEVAASKQGLEKAQGELEKTNQSLEEKLAELEKFKKLTIDRELKMVELKAEIAKCKNEAGKK